jgi:acyl-CoA thioester hydrolase
VSDAERFSMVQRVRFGDLDAMQHLNNVEFLRFFETARIEYISHLFPQHSPDRAQDFGFIFAECHIAYLAPGRYRDDVRTYVWVSEVRRSALRVDFEMVVDADDRKLAEGYGWLVGYDYASGRSQPLPDALRERLEPELRDPVG